MHIFQQNKQQGYHYTLMPTSFQKPTGKQLFFLVSSMNRLGMKN